MHKKCVVFFFFVFSLLQEGGQHLNNVIFDGFSSSEIAMCTQCREQDEEPDRLS